MRHATTTQELPPPTQHALTSSPTSATLPPPSASVDYAAPSARHTMKCSCTTQNTTSGVITLFTLLPKGMVGWLHMTSHDSCDFFLVSGKRGDGVGGLGGCCTDATGKKRKRGAKSKPARHTHSNQEDGRGYRGLTVPETLQYRSSSSSPSPSRDSAPTSS